LLRNLSVSVRDVDDSGGSCDVSMGSRDVSGAHSVDSSDDSYVSGDVSDVSEA